MPPPPPARTGEALPAASRCRVARRLRWQRGSEGGGGDGGGGLGGGGEGGGGDGGGARGRSSRTALEEAEKEVVGTVVGGVEEAVMMVGEEEEEALSQPQRPTGRWKRISGVGGIGGIGGIGVPGLGWPSIAAVLRYRSTAPGNTPGSTPNIGRSAARRSRPPARPSPPRSPPGPASMPPTDLSHAAVLAAAEAIRHAAGQSRRIVVLSGAGISAESGIPTFRDTMEGLLLLIEQKGMTFDR